MMRRGLAAAALALLAGPAAAATYAVVVGIDSYPNFGDLAGAVRDAEDIAAALERQDADVILITDEAATRRRIVEALRRQIARAVAGDTVVFTYAGHGIQEPEALVGDEEDGFDEAFALHGFDMSGEGAGERLRDNDISFLLRGAAPGVSVLFVADSCHSGTMTRGPAPGGVLGRTRMLDLGLGPIMDDPLPPPDPGTFRLEATDLPNVVFAAAARDNEQTPEVPIDGAPRGALSWALARALDERRGTGGLVDLRDFVLAQVRAHSGARQTPDIEFVAEGPVGVARLFGADSEPDDTASALDDEPPAMAPPPPLFVVGSPGPEELLLLSETAKLVADEAESALVWNMTEGRLVDRLSADLVSEPAEAADAAASIRKWRVVAGLARWSPRRAFDLRAQEGDDRHRIGDAVHFVARASAASAESGALTLFNLASGGEVQYVYPGP